MEKKEIQEIKIYCAYTLSKIAHGFFPESFRKPRNELVFITDFAYARPDAVAPNECLIELNRIYRKNGVVYKKPLIEDHEVYSLNPISGAFHVDMYARALEDIPTIFVGVVDPGVGGKREGIVIKTKKNHIYVGPNNGLFWEAVSREGVEEVHKVKDSVFESVKSVTFHGRDVFIPIAAEINSGKKPSQLKEWLEPFDQNKLNKLCFEKNQILHIDGFNLIKINTHVPPDAKYANITVEKSGKNSTIPTAITFVDKPGEIMTYSGSTRGLMEIAVSNKVLNYEGNAVKQLTSDPENPIVPGDIINIEWIY